MGPLGVPEMIFIFVLALLILGPKKLPEIGRTIGKGMAEFRRASNELRGTWEREMNAIEQEDQTLRSSTKLIEGEAPAASAAAPNVYGDAAYPYYDETTPSASATQAADTFPVPENGAGPEPVAAAESAAPAQDSGVRT
jgi:TatA/E family protein of Tat protein translocase